MNDVRRVGVGWPSGPGRLTGCQLALVPGQLIFQRPVSVIHPEHGARSRGGGRLSAVGWPRATLPRPGQQSSGVAGHGSVEGADRAGLDGTDDVRDHSSQDEWWPPTGPIVGSGGSVSRETPSRTTPSRDLVSRETPAGSGTGVEPVAGPGTSGAPMIPQPRPGMTGDDSPNTPAPVATAEPQNHGHGSAGVTATPVPKGSLAGHPPATPASSAPGTSAAETPEPPRPAGGGAEDGEHPASVTGEDLTTSVSGRDGTVYGRAPSSADQPDQEGRRPGKAENQPGLSNNSEQVSDAKTAVQVRGRGVSRETEDPPLAQEAKRAVQILNPSGEVIMPRPAQRRIVCVANQKGGVGKTTTAVNIAVALALHGNRVLLIDLDPQGNASTGLNVPHHAGVPDIYDCLIEGSSLDSVTQAVEGIPDLWAVPATIDLAGAEIELVSMVARENRLNRAISAAASEYDYIFIDCPPSLGLLTVNALVAAEEVLIPIQCEYYALEGVQALTSNIELVRSHLNPKLYISTILLTMYDRRTRLADLVEQDVRNHFGEKCLNAVIPRNVRVSEAPSYSQSVMTYDPGSRGAMSYFDAALEIALRGAPVHHRGGVE